MTNSSFKKTQDDVKIYALKKKKTSYNGKISIFILYHDDDRQFVEDIERDLKDRNIILKKDISEFDSYYSENIDIFNEVMYLVVIVSKQLLLDWDLMEIIHNCYDLETKDKIIPVIVQKELYDPKEKWNILNTIKQYIDEYDKTCFDKDYNGDIADELRRMQKILDTVKNFLKLSLIRDRRSNMSFAQRILRYIKHDMGIDLNKESEADMNKEENFTMKGQIEITNNFNGDVKELHMQQGNARAVQTQNIGQSAMDYEAVKKIIGEIKKSENQLDDVYGDNADKVRELLSEVSLLVEQKKEPNRIKDILLTIKELSLGIAESLVASGIWNLISGLGI